MRNGLDSPGPARTLPAMSHHTHTTHDGHEHTHGGDCGHVAVEHEGHVDYLHDGHLHHPHGDHVDEHVISVSDQNPDACTDEAAGHDPDHVHGEGCGHEPVPHGDHLDYLVEDRLHHPHEEHCDDHGKLTLA